MLLWKVILKWREYFTVHVFFDFRHARVNFYILIIAHRIRIVRNVVNICLAAHLRSVLSFASMHAFGPVIEIRHFAYLLCECF